MEWLLPLLSSVNRRIVATMDEAAPTQRSTPRRDAVLAARYRHLGSACTMFYGKEPLLVSRASKQYLYDENGERYLDCISNVQHVGHCHPSVAAAVSQQMAVSTCNVRFLDANLGSLLERLVHTLPPPLDTVYMVNSGSESNDVALRLARESNAHGATEIIVVEHAYHGHLTSTIGISPYKFNKMGPAAKPDFVHVAPVPDVYSGKYRLSDEELGDADALRRAGAQYADEVLRIVQRVEASGKRVLMFVIEALISCGGQIVPPPGYLEAVARHVRSAGGIVAVDEVQTGFGRSGSHFWAWQTHAPDFVPDIVTMGKPMGNGFPVSAVATSKQLASSLGKHVMYFNTFGGNPVSCAAALAVLDVLHKERLQQRALEVGQYFMRKLLDLKQVHPCIGDVRGVGLFIGIELVADRGSRLPATQLAADAIQALRRRHHVLLNAEGPHDNIIKIKPPMCFDERDVDEVCGKLHTVLAQLTTCANGVASAAR